MSLRSANQTPVPTNRSKKSHAPSVPESGPLTFATHTVMTNNPFKQLYQESKKYEVICRTLAKENLELNSIALTLAKEIEKFRAKTNVYKKQCIILAEENDNLKNKISYAEAQRQTAKKWVQDEYMLREEIEQQLQESERERDQLKQIVQLCKELMCSEEENIGDENNIQIDDGKIFPNLQNLTMGDNNSNKSHQRRKSKFEKRISLAYQNQSMNVQNNDESDKMSTLVRKLDSFRIDNDVVTTGPPKPKNRVNQLKNDDKRHHSPNYRQARSRFQDQEDSRAPFPSSSMFRPLSMVSRNNMQEINNLSPNISLREAESIDEIDFGEYSLDESRFIESCLETLFEESENESETLRSDGDLDTSSTVYIVDTSRTEGCASTIVNFE